MMWVSVGHIEKIFFGHHEVSVLTAILPQRFNHHGYQSIRIIQAIREKKSVLLGGLEEIIAVILL